MDVREQKGSWSRPQKHPNKPHRVCLLGKSGFKFEPQASNLLFFILDEKIAIHRINTATA